MAPDVVGQGVVAPPALGPVQRAATAGSTSVTPGCSRQRGAARPPPAGHRPRRANGEAWRNDDDHRAGDPQPGPVAIQQPAVGLQQRRSSHSVAGSTPLVATTAAASTATRAARLRTAMASTSGLARHGHDRPAAQVDRARCRPAARRGSSTITTRSSVNERARSMSAETVHRPDQGDAPPGEMGPSHGGQWQVMSSGTGPASVAMGATSRSRWR